MQLVGLIRIGGRQLDAMPLDGLRVLVLEDEFLIAMDVEQLCRDHGAADVVIVASLDNPPAGDAAGPRYDIAVLDLRLRGKSTLEFAHGLAARGIPFIFATGLADDHEISRDFPSVHVVSKPYRGPELIEAMVKARNDTP